MKFVAFLLFGLLTLTKALLFENLQYSTTITNLYQLNFKSENEYNDFIKSSFKDLDRNSDGKLSQTEFQVLRKEKESFEGISEITEFLTGKQLDFEAYTNIYMTIYINSKVLFSSEFCENFYSKIRDNRKFKSDIENFISLVSFQCSKGLSSVADYDIEKCLWEYRYNDLKKCIKDEILSNRIRNIEKKFAYWVILDHMSSKYNNIYSINLSNVFGEKWKPFQKTLKFNIAKINQTAENTFELKAYQFFISKSIPLESIEYHVVDGSPISLLKNSFPISKRSLINSLIQIAEDPEVKIDRPACSSYFTVLSKCHADKLSIKSFIASYIDCVTGKLNFDPDYSSKSPCVHEKYITSGSRLLESSECASYDTCFVDKKELFKNPRKKFIIEDLTIFKDSVVLSIDCPAGLAIVSLAAVAISTGLAIYSVHSSSTYYYAERRSKAFIRNMNKLKILKKKQCSSIQYYWGTCGLIGQSTSTFCPDGRRVSNVSCTVPGQVGRNFDIVCGLKKPHSKVVPFFRNRTLAGDRDVDGLERDLESTPDSKFECQSLCILDSPHDCVFK